MSQRLPGSIETITGLRVARWFRESTAGQWDNFGPDAQREQQDRAIARYSLVDSALEWSVASSGWTSAWRTPTWEAMVVSAEAGAFDVLVVGYVSRFLRNLKQTLIAVEDHLHAAGVVVLFADERLLSSDPSNWDQFVREAHEAEAYSRKLSGGSVKAMPRSDAASGCPAAIGRRSASSARASPRRFGSMRRRRRRFAAHTNSRPSDRPTGRWQQPPALRRPTSASYSRTRSTPVVSAPVSPPALRPSSSLPSGPRCSRCASCAGPGRPAGSSSATTRSACAVRAASGSSTATWAGTATRRRPATRSSLGRLTARRRYTKGDDKRAEGHSYPQAWYEDAIGAPVRSGPVDDVAITEAVRRYHDRPRGRCRSPGSRQVESARKPRGAWRRRAT